jgi:uncharacterized protein
MIVRERARLAWMKREFAPERLDVARFALAGTTLEAADPVVTYARVAAELATGAETDALVRWSASGEERPGADGKAEPWLHLDAEATLPLTCQRCLTPVATPVVVNRWFRFVADEATAEAEDEEAEEDVLATSRDFDLRALVEDELLMEIPVTPVHDVCPVPVRLSSSDDDFKAAEEAKPNPFAVLGTLRPRGPKEGK